MALTNAEHQALFRKRREGTGEALDELMNVILQGFDKTRCHRFFSKLPEDRVERAREMTRRLQGVGLAPFKPRQKE